MKEKKKLSWQGRLWLKANKMIVALFWLHVKMKGHACNSKISSRMVLKRSFSLYIMCDKMHIEPLNQK